MMGPDDGAGQEPELLTDPAASANPFSDPMLWMMLGAVQVLFALLVLLLWLFFGRTS